MVINDDDDEAAHFCSLMELHVYVSQCHPLLYGGRVSSDPVHF